MFGHLVVDTDGMSLVSSTLDDTVRDIISVACILCLLFDNTKGLPWTRRVHSVDCIVGFQGNPNKLLQNVLFPE